LDIAYKIIQCIVDSDERTPKMKIFTEYNAEEILKVFHQPTVLIRLL
jgi:hypothetical protein